MIVLVLVVVVVVVIVIAIYVAVLVGTACLISVDNIKVYGKSTPILLTRYDEVDLDTIVVYIFIDSAICKS